MSSLTSKTPWRFLAGVVLFFSLSFIPAQPKPVAAKDPTRRTAKELMHAYLSNIQDPAVEATLFADDGVIELPYLASIGQPWHHEGPEAIKEMMTGLLKTAPQFKFINIHVFIETPDQVFAEYSVDCLFNGKPYKQTYMGRLVAENGKIKLIREGMNMYPVIKIFGLGK